MAFAFDYTSILYNPIYTSIGVVAVLSINNSAGNTADITVIDHTAGIAVDDRGGIGLQTIKPVAYVRAVELEQNDIESWELPNAQLTFNNNDWQIESFQPKPSPGGEADGEYMLILIELTGEPPPQAPNAAPITYYVDEDS